MEEWYTFMAPIGSKMREVAVRLTAAEAEGLGATHAPDFDEEAARRAGMVIGKLVPKLAPKLAPEGGLEAAILAERGLTAEIPNR